MRLLPGARQSAFQILASSSLANYQGKVYDACNGPCVVSNSSQSLSIPFLSPQLAGGAPACIYAGVAVFDGSGVACDATVPLRVCAAPSPTQWQAAPWITDNTTLPADDCGYYAPERTATRLLRSSFQLAASPILSAHLFVAAAGAFTAYVNGAKMGDAALEPPWTTFDKRVYVSSYDLTFSQTLVPGAANAIGVELGSGWYDPLPMRLFGNFDFRDWLPVGTPALSVMLAVTYADAGGPVYIVSDTTWRVAKGSTTFNNIYLGVRVDERAAATLAGWSTASFNDSSWQRAVVANTSNVGPRETAAIAPIRVTSTYVPTTIQHIAGDTYVVTFPANMAGVVALKNVRAPAGWVTNLTFAELLFSNGTVNTITNLAGAIGRWNGGNWGDCAIVPAIERDTITWSGSGNETFVPQFTWHAFQYVQIDNWPTATAGAPTAANLEARQYHVDAAPAGDFAAWSDQLVAIDGMARQSFRSNWAGGIQSDCPGRERLGYGGDLLAAAEAAMLQFDVGAFYAKRVRDYGDAARANGGLPETAPFVGIATCDSLGGGTGPMQWGSAHSWLQLELLAYYGDTALLEEAYPTTVAWMSLLNSSVNASGALVNGLADFTQNVGLCNPRNTGVMGTAWLVNQARNAAGIARTLGRSSDAAAFAAVGDAALAAFQALYVNSTTGVVGIGDLDSQLWATYLDLLPPLLVNASIARIRSLMAANGSHLYAGAFGTSFALRGGPGWGLSDMLYQALSATDYPGYGFMLANGATALYEHWAALWEQDSLNHAWLGSVAAFMRRYVAGLSHADDAIGMDAIIVRPFPPPLNSSAAWPQPRGRAPQVGAPGTAPLPWAALNYTSARGNVSVSWWYAAANELHVLVSLPANVRATVYVPLPPGAVSKSYSACAPAVYVPQPGADVFNLDYVAGVCEMSATW